MSSPMLWKNMKPRGTLTQSISRVALRPWESCKIIFLVCTGGNQSSQCHGKIASVRIKPTPEKQRESWLGRRGSLQMRWKMIKCHLIISKRDDVTESSLKWESWQCADLLYTMAGPQAPPIYSKPPRWLPGASWCSFRAEGSLPTRVKLSSLN